MRQATCLGRMAEGGASSGSGDGGGFGPRNTMHREERVTCVWVFVERDE